MTDINWFPLFFSLRVAFLATIVGILIGLPIAYYLSKSRSRLSDLIDTVLTLPIVLPPTVLGYYLLVALGRQSWLGQFLEANFGIMLVFTPMGAVIAAAVVSIPFLIKSARSAFAEVDRNVIHAAMLLGRNEWNIFISIIVPLAWRGMMSGIILAFARALGDFGTTLMVSGSIPNQTLTMPIAIYDALQAGDKDTTFVMVLIMTAVAFTLLFLLNRLEKRLGRRNF
jgi:molybdate transport system permease protein